MEQLQQNQEVKKVRKIPKIIKIAVIVFALFFVAGYVSGTMVSYEEKWFGAGPTFWDALKPF